MKNFNILTWKKPDTLTIIVITLAITFLALMIWKNLFDGGHIAVLLLVISSLFPRPFGLFLLGIVIGLTVAPYLPHR